MTKKKAAPQAVTTVPGKNPVGRPTKYEERYCKMLVEHCKGGNSFESFATKCGVSPQTLYTWQTVYPEFLDARKEGWGWLNKFYEDTGKLLATGGLRRLISEEPMLDSRGQPIPDPEKPGEYLMRREYEAVHGNSTAWIFLCKNMLGWKDKREITFGDQDPEGGDDGEQSVDDLLKEIQEMRDFMQEVKGEPAKPIIDVSPSSVPPQG